MKNEVGNRYGKLTVLRFAGTKRHSAYWLCACDCGLTTITSGTNLRSGHTTSCGCVKSQYIRMTHGYSDSEPLYGVWEQMRSRCNNHNNPRFPTYGGNGVRVCDEWNDYSKFRSWAFANGYIPSKPGTPRKDRMSIDRIDPKGNYDPNNCRWITVSENSERRTGWHANQR